MELNGRRYQDFLIFLMNMAVYRLYETKRIVLVEHSLGDGVYCEMLENSEPVFDEGMLERIKKEMNGIIKEDIPIISQMIPVGDVHQLLIRINRPDVIKNITFNKSRLVHLYFADDYYDYCPRLLPNTTLQKVKYDLVKVNQGFILRFLPADKAVKEKKFVYPRLLFSQFQEHEKWIKILNVQTAGDINRLIDKKAIRDFVLTEEALHEKKIAQLADFILLRDSVKFVLIAGPSSSGKTTFTKRLAIQLKVNGYEPHIISLDDYFLPRTKTPKLPNGDFDFESIRALDVKQINEDLAALLKGKEVKMPHYNFLTGKREESGRSMILGYQNILLIEGIHGLNEALTEKIPAKNKVKIYTSALNQLNIDFHNRIPTTECRKIRRIVRDAQYRGYSAEETLARWDAISDGETQNIFPFQEDADFMFNSTLTFELGVLRKHVLPLLRAIDYISPVYNEAQDLITLLEHFLDIKDELVPHNSILREFISNSVFDY